MICVSKVPLPSPSITKRTRKGNSVPIQTPWLLRPWLPCLPENSSVLHVWFFLSFALTLRPRGCLSAVWGYLKRFLLSFISHTLLASVAAFSKGVCQRKFNTHFSHYLLISLLTHQKTNAIWYFRRLFSLLGDVSKGRGAGPSVRWLSFVPSSTLDSIHALGQVTKPLRAAVSGDEICQLHHVDLNLSGIRDKNTREPGVHVGSNWWEETDHRTSKISLSFKLCNRVRPHQCPWAFVQWPVGSILALVFFQKKEGTALTSQFVYPVYSVSPRLCTSPAAMLTTDCCYLLDHLPPGLEASRGRGSCLPHATLYPQYQAHAWQIDVMPEIFAEGMNSTATEYPTSASLRLPIPSQDVVGSD